VAVGGTCAVEGCNRTHMYNSPVCYKHKDKAEDIWWAENDESSERRAPPKSVSAPGLILDVFFPNWQLTLILSVVFLMLIASGL
jgi:hypothetical protein